MSTVLESEVPTKPVAPAQPGLDIRALIEEHAGRNYELQSAHINPANVRTLKTIGFDRCYVRAEGAYLWDTITEIGRRDLQHDRLGAGPPAPLLIKNEDY